MVANTPDDKLKHLRGFPAGVNNVAPDNDPPRDEFGNYTSLREAVNVDLIGPRKQPRQRPGYTLKLTGATHSPACIGHTLLLVVDGDLNAYDAQLNLQSTLRPDLGRRHLTYADVYGDLYYSNGQEFRRIRGADLADLPAWIDCPGTPQASPVDGYGYAPGTYRVAVTWFDAEGRESAAAGTAIVDLTADQGIRLHNIPTAPETAVKMRAYVSPPDDAELYMVTDLATTVTNTILPAPEHGARALETLHMLPMPPCDTMRFWNGLLLGVSGNLLRWSVGGGRYGLTDAGNYLRLGLQITLCEPVGVGSESAGCWLADHKYTYWMAGPKPKDWRRVTRYDHPAVPGTSLLVKGKDIGLDTTDMVAFWLAKNGVFCAGLPGGTLVPLTEGRLALPEGEVGASLFREYAGIRQLMTVFISKGANSLAVGDSASATVIRKHAPQTSP
jgi:hypothetical protein